VKRFVVLPISGADYSTFKDTKYADMKYNLNFQRPNLFSVLDAAGLLWHAREFFNVADANRPHGAKAQPCDEHPHATGWAETFYRARERFRGEHPDKLYEVVVKDQPAIAFPPSLIGSMCDDTWRRYFPLLPINHPLRDKLRKIRALDYMWGMLPSYSSGAISSSTSDIQKGAWMPLSYVHHIRLLRSVGLYNEKYKLPSNPWRPPPISRSMSRASRGVYGDSGEYLDNNDSRGIASVFTQSYHSPFCIDNPSNPKFAQWIKEACKYQFPRPSTSENKGALGHYYPFSQYGGTPVEADFAPHRFERPGAEHEWRAVQIAHNRFGCYKPLRIGNQYNDAGMLQDMFMFEYRPYANLSAEQRSMPPADAVYISNFLAFARTHSIIALASCQDAIDAMSETKMVRNLYRLYVDTYECMGPNPNDEGAPAVMGFTIVPDGRPVVLYAGSLTCINSRLYNFMKSQQRPSDDTILYKQTYLNEAALLYTRLLKIRRREILRTANYNCALLKRQHNYPRWKFDKDVISLQDLHIDMLQKLLMTIFIQMGWSLHGMPLHLLEPRELRVSLTPEDENFMPGDIDMPRLSKQFEDMIFGDTTLSKTQIAFLSLFAPHDAILGTMKLMEAQEDDVDLSDIKAQIAKNMMKRRKEFPQLMTLAFFRALLGYQTLERDGMGASAENLFAMDTVDTSILDDFPDKAAVGPFPSITSPGDIERELFKRRSEPMSTFNMKERELKAVLSKICSRIDAEYAKRSGTRSKMQILQSMNVSREMKELAAKMLEERERGE
jgi:hypothetical protein